ncbi:shikimate dehydrogenase [Terriglobus aquaticus]|uniref:Multifunctional fusion protein n=1 Tax=Terriglobus aquaticus TaxID=940139 RepID=A0ABW9KL11_9BACT|nr:shikimate dehydrogenase [Terriglobus aquaticus]
MPPTLPSLPRICVALSGDGMASLAAETARSFPFLEFRLDTAPEPFEAVFEMGAFLRKHPAVRVIATCRRSSNGGQFAGTAADEVEMLRQAIAVGAHIVDLSLETAEELAINPHALAPLRRGPNALLLSWHDFHGTPPLAPVLDRMHRVGADLYKIVPTATTLRDSFALLDLLEAHSADRNLVAMSMGAPGTLTRILGPRFGSLFTFASPTSGTPTAPGQIDAATLRDLYRLESITPQTEVYAVFGKPISGSRSPVMLNTAFRTAGREAVYLPLETDNPDELFLAWRHLHLAGASVTMPLKETILPQLTELDPQARTAGAANTLQSLPDDSIRGSNTDILGILAPLDRHFAERGSTLSGKSALVLGAGGVARAALHALKQRGCQTFLTNRTLARADALAAETGATALPPDTLPGRHFDLVLNGTPYGMPTSTMAAPIDFSVTPCGLFFDLVYNPIETPLIRSAREHGIVVIPGVEMFLAQGAAQYQTWTGEPAPLDAMQAAVYRSIL